ncbi:MAG TPA: AAA family ATPase [Candidatus Dormibacteraeota bacterium]|nr:AAA family ATPase [Candidatus Dormibacteraeota bacterium]
MFLKSLQLLGFKTFARQTEIQFDGGVTAIVGPNGSGKTNIVDSVKWVLGSGQAKDLRGKKMEEVIYAGGERRPRAGFAEVTMVFDNTAGRLPVDYHEVAIKRRIERDSESDYYLNGTRVRRRDLLHLLSSTGLTVDSYAIIDQHDIEHIVVCSPTERRQLLEEAAQVRGVKQRRQEAASKLQELATNLLRLEDLKGELTPRLETLRVQAAAAKEAAEANARLELLRGSIVWEEWREARDAHRRATSQQQSLERRLIEAREQARIAEDEFQTGRAAMQAAQDRRLAGQRNLGHLRLQVSEADHRLQLAEERAENRRTVAESARRAEAEDKGLLEAAASLRGRLAAELATAGQSEDEAPTDQQLHEAEMRARVAEESAARLTRLRSELEGIDSLDPSAGAGLRLRDVVVPEAGYEKAVAAALGALLDAKVGTDEPSALEPGTYLFPTPTEQPEDGSVYHHVTARDGYAAIARRLLGHVVVGRDVTLDGVYREPGLIRAGADPRTALDARKAELKRQIEALQSDATVAGDAAAELRRLRQAADRARLRTHVASLESDLPRLIAASQDRRERVVQAEQALAAAAEAIPELRRAAEMARQALAGAEKESPEDEAEMAESARRLVALEETRIDARLKAGTLEGNLELVAREAELLGAKMEEIRSRMPDGVAPEEIPGGKAREREMRQLERRLIEIGPTNALAEAECRELEERYENLVEQLDDITKAREDLEDLIGKLRQEEESRYEAVFGAVAANFHEYFAELNPGGRATLRHAEGDDGPRSGVEILVQPPRKRLQNVTLLSSGERSLAALALVLALDEVNPSPFTILDEVDAALDDANVDRFGKMLTRLGADRQFLVITHNHVTMSYASTLYGIHLDESGSSHLVSVRLDDVRKPASRAASTAQAG